MTQGAVSRIRATAFGLDLHGDIPLWFLEDSSTIATGRALEISTVRDDGVEALAWPRSARLVCDERWPDGGVVFQIETHPDSGYLISGPAYGSHLLSADGRRLVCVPEGLPDDAWQRLLIAQVLPFAALLQGLEVFHASAVVRDGEAIAFLGPSRAGKTSLALDLCDRGAGFLADDVLALESRSGELLAHPGTPIAGVDHEEAERRQKAADRSEQPIFVNARERLVQMRNSVGAAPLGALFFLDRRPGASVDPIFEPVLDPQMLLAATFNFVLSTPGRLRGLLDVCAMAARLRVERIVVDPAIDASTLGGAVERRLSLSA